MIIIYFLLIFIYEIFIYVFNNFMRKKQFFIQIRYNDTSENQNIICHYPYIYYRRII